MVISASCGAGPPEQLACIAAQDGTAPGLPSGLGLGSGVGVGTSPGLDDGLDEAPAIGVDDGLVREAEPFVPEQPAMANMAMTAASLSPTWKCNASPGADVTEPRIEVTASTISPPVSGVDEQQVYELKTALAAALLLCAACLDSPIPLTADVSASATQAAKVGGRAQLVVNVVNTGPALTHVGLTFLSADKWYERHTVTDPGVCTIDLDHSAFDCGALAAGASVTFSITGNAKQAGSFHYELALRELVRPFKYVNDHPDGADVQTWDETIGGG